MRVLTALERGLLLASLLTLNGCLASAVAPAAVQALGTLGISAGNSIAGKGSASDPDEDRTEWEPESSGCQQLLLAIPYIAEVRFESDQTAQVRQWTIGMVKGEQRWTVVRDAGTDGAGWRRETALGQLNFEPPLESALVSTKSRYMVAAPADPANTLESNQLMSFTIVFGPRTGTYDWNGRRYEYAAANKLPCVPGPSDRGKN